MEFHEKMDFLMYLTKTSNAKLGKISNLDNSFISRLRSGSRSPSKNQNYTPIFAAYFARQIRLNHQRSVLLQMMKMDPSDYPDDDEKAAEIIDDWLLDQQRHTDDVITKYAQQEKSIPAVSRDENEKVYQCTMNAYFGLDGAKDAILHFLDAAKTMRQKHLKIFDDSGTMEEASASFKSRYFEKLMQLTELGFEIELILNIERPAESLLDEMKDWLPLLLTGKVDVYYFPRYRDQEFCHLIMLVPENQSLVQNIFSRSEEDNSIVTLITEDRIINRHYEQEFQSYLKHCRSLSSVYTSEKTEHYLQPIYWFDTSEGDSIGMLSVFTSLTMPQSLITKIFSRIGMKVSKDYFDYQRSRIAKFQRDLGTYKFTEITALPPIDQILSGTVPVSFPALFNSEELYYTPGEFVDHLRNIIKLLRNYDNYQLYLASRPQIGDVTIHVKDCIGAQFNSSKSSEVYFFVTERTVSRVFENYLEDVVNYIPTNKREKKSVIEILQNTIDQVVRHIPVAGKKETK